MARPVADHQGRRHAAAGLTVAPACSGPAPLGAPARGSAKGPRPRAWSFARSRSRGARLLPSGRLRAPRTRCHWVGELTGLSALSLSAAGRAAAAAAESLDRGPGLLRALAPGARESCSCPYGHAEDQEHASEHGNRFHPFPLLWVDILPGPSYARVICLPKSERTGWNCCKAPWTC
jgi:hypothetical protein